MIKVAPINEIIPMIVIFVSKYYWKIGMSKFCHSVIVPECSNGTYLTIYNAAILDLMLQAKDVTLHPVTVYRHKAWHLTLSQSTDTGHDTTLSQYIDTRHDTPTYHSIQTQSMTLNPVTVHRHRTWHNPVTIYRHKTWHSHLSQYTDTKHDT